MISLLAKMQKTLPCPQQNNGNMVFSFRIKTNPRFIYHGMMSTINSCQIKIGSSMINHSNSTRRWLNWEMGHIFYATTSATTEITLRIWVKNFWFCQQWKFEKKNRRLFQLLLMLLFMNLRTLLLLIPRVLSSDLRIRKNENSATIWSAKILQHSIWFLTTKVT